MRKIFITNILVFILAMPTFLNAQIVTDKSFKTYYPKTGIIYDKLFFEAGVHILPIILNQKISGLSVSGNVIFTGEMGFVRIVLTDDKDYDYLVLETNTIFENEINILFDEFCEETALLNNILPKQITIEYTDAEIMIYEIQYTTNGEYKTSIDKQIKGKQLDAKLQHINTVLAKKETTWGAGKTSLSEITYMEKKDRFGGKVPNLAGFDHYISGIYVMQGYKPNNDTLFLRSNTISPFVSEFDWRNRHGRNWITSVKDQGNCGSCWIFSAVGTVEAYVNLYYNQLLNLDLSEQEILSCNGLTNCSHGLTAGSALAYMEYWGVVDETCFGYAASDLPCNDKCMFPDEKINISSYSTIGYNPTSNDLKKNIIKTPLTFAIHNDYVQHLMGLVGFKTIQLGDSICIITNSGQSWVKITSGNPLIGSNAWIIKNSYGPSWGENGFCYMVVNWSDVKQLYSISGDITSLNYTNNDIVCEDRDGDGYYYWGIGPKPATCPCWVPDEPDGDDSDPNLGPIDEFGNCRPLTSITTSQTWSTNEIIYNNIIIHSGTTLTITGDISFSENASILVHPGGKLIIDGGMLTNATQGEMWQGVTVLGNCISNVSSQGLVQIKNGGIIENARIGIYAINGGMIGANKAQFINNTIAAQITPVLATQLRISATFTQTQFIIDDNYLGNSLDFEAHLKLFNSKLVTIEGCTLLNETSQTNHIYGKSMGIWAFNSPLTVHGSCLPGSPMGPNGECLYINPSIFSGFNIAISATNSGKSPLVSITNSEFLDNLSGIELNAIDYANIVRNKFDLSLLNAHGLFVQQSTGYIITENNFVNTNKALQTKGIIIDKSGSDENMVYKNSFENLYVGVQATDKNSLQNFGQPPPPFVTGLQFQCNDFEEISQADILVGYLPGGLQPSVDNSVRRDQGASQQPAGNKFIQSPFTITQRINFANQSNYYINYYYGRARYEEPVTTVGSVFKYQTNSLSHCPSLIGPPHRGGYLDGALAQYDEWNAEYKDWLVKLLAFEGNNEEEYNFILDMVSYYSALKDNYFNSIIVAAMNEEKKEEGGKQKAEGNEFPSKFEGIPEEQGSLYETFRFLFAYRAHYTDYLSIAETYLAESNYNEALATLAKIYAQFEVTEEQILELKGFETYIHWLQQLDEKGENIYTLFDEEIKHLVNYVETHTGRGTMFAKNILCKLYRICIEEAEGGKQKAEGADDETIDLRKSVTSVLSACEKSTLENITIHPNPTTGELQVTSYRLRITSIEVFDVYGRKLSSFTSHISIWAFISLK